MPAKKPDIQYEETLTGVNETAYHFGITPQWVQELAAEGVIPKEKHGTYPFKAAARQYIAWLKSRDAIEPDELNPNELNPKYERARLHKAQADKVEMDNAIRRGEHVHIEDIRASWLTVQSLLNSQIDALPGRLAGILAAKAGADRGMMYDILLEETTHIRDAISNGLATIGSDSGNGASSPPAAEAGGVGMGGSPPDTAKRGR